MDLHAIDYQAAFAEAAKQVEGSLRDLPTAHLDEFPAEGTVCAVVDLNVGFCRQGALASPYADAVVPRAAALARACAERQIYTLAYTDCHRDDSPEFSAYPPHCVKGSGEEKVVEQIAAVPGIKIVEKASTNGFLNWYIKELLDRYEVGHLIVTGCVTDICVYQLATTCKAYANVEGRELDVVVPLDCVDTFDIPGVHGRDFYNAVFAASMQANGVRLVERIEW
ncbi:cysteine hydrolase [Acetanaerobacterium sp. MSJ-12]|uniref:cysteine hydrolase family protein n=1 Tax=Acetanaerobacterium sp. MSJ-12 TaxID=2841535 RepID=UPI001C0F3467|nr:isochorismatase family cysteine hydrolase [Acetanaerobacterium sp. MSJ-12]MBU5419754.1 cysteine hydrolase [Acetanaerobacterium sp. MSJ-12]